MSSLYGAYSRLNLDHHRLWVYWLYLGVSLKWVYAMPSIWNVRTVSMTLKLRVDGNSKYLNVTCLLVHSGNIDPILEQLHYCPKWHRISVILRLFQMSKGYGYDSHGVQKKRVVKGVFKLWWSWTRHNYSMHQITCGNRMLVWSDLVRYCVYRIEESMEETLLEEMDEDSAVVHWVTPYSPVDRCLWSGKWGN